MSCADPSSDLMVSLNERLKAEGRIPGPFVAEPKPLAKLSHHTGAVNVVRWSTCGTLLASGGAEGTVAVWQVLVAGSAENERWSVAREHRLHIADVLDVAWSPDLVNLASCALDNKVVVFNVMTQAYYVVSLAEITKGLAWDPLGEYLAGAGEGKTGVTMWKVEKEKESDNLKVLQNIKEVKKPYEEYLLPSQFRRFNWSPNAEFLITTHGVSNQFPIAPIITRRDLDAKYIVMGPTKAVTVAKFHPGAFGHPAAKDKYTMYLAVGTGDGELSVWNAAQTDPVCRINSSGDNRILDITWHDSGNLVFACGSNGLVYFAVLEKCPRVLSKEEFLTVTKDKAKVISEYNEKVTKRREVYLANIKNSKVEAPAMQKEQTEIRTASKKRQITPQILSTWTTVQPILPPMDAPIPTAVVPHIEPPKPQPTHEPVVVPNPVPELPKIREIAPVAQTIIPLQVYEEELKKNDGKFSVRLNSPTHMEELTITSTLNSFPDLQRYTDIKCTDVTGKVYFLITLINEKVLKLCANSNFIAVYTDANCLHIYNLFGMSLSEPFYIPSVCFLECNQRFSLLATQITGELFLWDVGRQELLIKVNVLDLLVKTRPDTLTKVFLDDSNNVLLNTKSGKVFRYDFQMGIFKKIKDLQTCSIRANIDFEHVKPHSMIAKVLFSGTYEPATLEMERKIDQRRIYQYESNSLEERLSTAKVLKLPEYWILFRKYVLLLVEAKNYEKLKALCMELVAVKEKREIRCTVLNFTEDERREGRLMGKSIDNILMEEICKLVEGCEDPNVVAIIGSIHLRK